ncbi:hypothetical protein TPHA_0M00650 [Tetrapisispora phaffii CBS 4417]|uniref:Galactokinase n=1 Tax=Tetrapisispora phaffii (strain ATCC 24235 / CBS 4417 / NBRC 1672 / NRRL Y-8282 / UCD 70-5) TaxID=1071381 RepID=G8C0C5_TETPH|nr:hypothetical protein TPHA_0M00650 [Tetrapisispora phaffii CBS 4417]CCE65640.1 hypothetical protein TPHA_0M00650 [Tetrapisispora phaffii CBS 4417]
MQSLPVFRIDNDNKNVSDITKKCIDITLKFQDKFKYYPNFIVSSPGRVNIIGEHIDYEEFPVLPMAINKNILCAVRILENSHSISIYNDNYEKFAEKKFDLPLNGELISIDPSISDWSNYFKCGLLVAHKFLKKKYPDRFNNAMLKGLYIYIKGDIPTESGISSSAAMCVTVAALIIRSNLGPEYSISKKELIAITEGAEHYIGVSTGSMDPAVIICNESNKLSFINFKPQLSTSNVELPVFNSENNIRFLIANTLVSSNKYETGPINYNLRVVEDTIAANILAAKYGFQLNRRMTESFTYDEDDYDMTFNSTRKQQTFSKGNLRDFMDAYFARHLNDESELFINPNDHNSIKRTEQMLNTMINLLDNCFPNDNNQHSTGYSIPELAGLLNCSRDEFTREYLLVNPVRFQTLKVYQRSKHVFTEALRVIKCIELINFHGDLSMDRFLKELGRLMHESQRSCDELYECSCPEIDEVCEIAIANGSYGSRLTGAGWGGCTVHLVSSDEQIENIKRSLRENYYLKHNPSITEEELKNAMIVSTPSMGSCIFEL